MKQESSRKIGTREVFKIVLVIVLSVFICGAVSYGAFFTVKKQTDENTIASGCFSTTFTDGTSINVSGYPMSDADGKNTDPYAFTITNTCSLGSKYYVILSVKTDSFSDGYINLMYNNEDVKTLSSVTTNALYLVETGYTNSYIIGEGTLGKGKSVTNNVRLWINSVATYENVSGKTWEGQIKVVSVATPEKKYSSEEILASLNLTAKTGTPSFSAVATTDETADGLYSMEDDYGTSYYFRGAAENNYVKFANRFWRIIRINGDGSLRILYDGTSAHANGEYAEDRTIGNSAFNTSYDDNAYVGYMYGLAGTTTDANRCLILENDVVTDKVSTYASKSACETAGGVWTTTAYEATHANVKSSAIKEYLDNWYKTNIVDTGYNSAVSDEIFCNDRSMASTSGIWDSSDAALGYGTNKTYYGAYNRLNTREPKLTCSQKSDAFTVSDTEKGNGDLEYPVGLITGDEVSLAGGVHGTTNERYYLNKGDYYWSLSPYLYYIYAGADVLSVSDYGSMDGINVNSEYDVVPVINLSAEYSKQLKGTGSMEDPYTAS